MKHWRGMLAAWLLGAMAAGAGAQSAGTGVPAQAPALPPGVKGALVMEDLVASRLKVLGVDAARRQLRLQAGELNFRIRVRDSVPLDRIQAGDEIDVLLMVREVLALRKGDGISKSETSVVETPDGAVAGLRLDRVYNVLAVDQAASRIRLGDANRQEAWLRVQSAQVMADVQVGDQVRAVLTVVEVAGLQPQP